MKHNIIKRSTINLFAATGVILLLQACSHQPDYKAARDQVINLHDKLMDDDGLAVNDKLKLKSLATPAALQNLKTAQPQTDTVVEKTHITSMIKHLDSVSNAMSDWMNQFEPDVQGKSDQQAADYFKAEKLKVNRLDSSYKVVLKTSDAYLAKFHIKADSAKAQPMKMKM